MTLYTDDQACIVATVDAGGPRREEHRKTVPAWAALDPVAARQQRDFVRHEVRAEVGPDVQIYVRIVPGYCDRCAGVLDDAREADRMNLDRPLDEHAAGLLRKYDVKRRDDPTGKHDTCRFFVLDPQHDPLARKALAAYAEAADSSWYGPLAADLMGWLNDIESATGVETLMPCVCSSDGAPCLGDSRRCPACVARFDRDPDAYCINDPEAT